MTLTYEHNVFSLEFAALSYANSHKNRYRYRLEGFDPDWNDVDSKNRLATYTNLVGEYVFRVQGSNSDGIWNDARSVAGDSDHTALVEDQLVSRAWAWVWFWRCCGRRISTGCVSCSTRSR